MKTLGTALAIGAITLASLVGCNKNLETYRGNYGDLKVTLQQNKDGSEKFIRLLRIIPDSINDISGYDGWLTAHDFNGNGSFDSNEIESSGLFRYDPFIKYNNPDSLNKISKIILETSVKGGGQ